MRNLQNKLVSIVIVNYKGTYDTHKCVESLNEIINEPNHVEIIIVDNSEDNKVSFTKLQELLSDNLIKTTILSMPNKGFGAANNLGVTKANGELLFFLNNDTKVINFPISISTILELFKNPQIGMLAPRVFNPDFSIQPNTSTYVSLFTSTLRFLRVGNVLYKSRIFRFLAVSVFSKFSKVSASYFDRERNHNKKRYVDWASGCALLVRKEDFINIGMFDENFFMYFEDEELCYRFKMKGQVTYYNPIISLIHYVGLSGKANRKIEIERIKSEIYFYRKHFPEKSNLLISFYKILSFITSPFNSRLRSIFVAFLRKEI